MTAKALKLIQQEMELKTGKLDLRWCKLKSMPDELLEMNWLGILFFDGNNIDAIKNLDSLQNLQVLTLDFNLINEIENLDALINLTSLSLKNNKIEEIKNLNSLRKLKSLSLSNNQIKEIKNLELLTEIESLSLDNNQITEIANLKSLIALKSLTLGGNKIREIKNLESLNGLLHLDLKKNIIGEIKNLINLKNLIKLDLESNEIIRIENLNRLNKLQDIYLSYNPLYYLENLPDLVVQPQISTLCLLGIESNSLNIPPEHFGFAHPDDGPNCLEALRGYFASLKKGSFQLKELPLILVGNSTAGKTSLRYFLQQNVFPPPEDYSTHGIESSVWHPDEESLINLDENIKPKDLQLFFWDFGGQEYYHATHRLFFSKKAIYILVWERKTNKQAIENIDIKMRKADGEIESATLPVELFPYEYWLQSIRHLAPDIKESPVILLQNKIDEEGNEETDTDSTLLRENNCKPLQLSIKKAYELNGEGRKDPLVDILLQRIFSVAKDLSSTIVYGGLWEDIKKMLQQVREEQIWTVEKFKQEVRLLDPVLQDNSIMLSYVPSLDKIKALLYIGDDALLRNYVFLNPGWVTEMIYSILDRSVLENKGEFDKVHIIKKAGNEYADIFIALMKKFELIFYNEELEVFIAPQYLPLTLADKRKSNELKAQFDLEKPGFLLQFKNFMPRYIMLRFLVAYGENAIGKYYWKNGIAFTIEKCSVLVLSDYDKKQFRVFTENNNQYVQRLVFDKLVQLSENTHSLLVSNGDTDFVDYTALLEEFPDGKFTGNATIKSATRQRVPLAPFKDFFEDIETIKRKYSNNQAKKIKLFISYAHVDNEIRKLFEERYLKAIQDYYDENIEVWSDIKLKPGAPWDAKIKNEINAADIIIFFLTNSFLSSNYIKETEIVLALERYKQRQQIIVPVYIEEISKKLLPFSEKQYLPGSKPLKEWRPQNKGWVKIQDDLITIIDDIKNGNAAEYFE